MHLTKLWSGDLVKQMEKTNQEVGDKNPLDKSGRGRKTSLSLCKERVMEKYWLHSIGS